MIENRPRVLILFLTYGDAYKGSRERFIAEYCTPLSCQKRLIIIENADENLPVRKIGDWIYEMGGDNSVFEFSGWQKAIDSETASSFNADLYIFANSSLYTQRVYGLPIINDEIVDIMSQYKFFSGKVRKRSFELTYEGLDLSLMVPTRFFAMHREILEDLGCIISEYESEKFIKPTYSSDIFTDNNLWKGLLKKTTMADLTRKYHKNGIMISPEYHRFFARKILAITNEILLTGRIKKLGYKITDSTPFPKFSNSYYTIFTENTTIRPFQFIRATILMSIYYLFRNSLADKIGLGNWFRNRCASNVKRHLLRENLRM